MKRLIGISLLLLMAAPAAWAQDMAAVEQRVEALRQQLLDVTEKQSRLQARGQELDESLRPENIEKSVAGIGTTDASALRDRRREQLEREKAVVAEQLRSLEASRARLESAIATAEAEAVRLRASALGASNSPTTVNAAPSSAPSASTPAASVAPAKRNARRVAKPRRRARTRRATTPRR